MTTPDYAIRRATRTSGRGGYPCRWTVYEIHRAEADGTTAALLRASGAPREFSTEASAMRALRRLVDTPAHDRR